MPMPTMNLPAHDKTAEEIRDDNQFLQVEPGERRLRVMDVAADGDKMANFQCEVNGLRSSFDAQAIIVKFCDVHDVHRQCQDRFVLPPATADKRKVEAYQKGVIIRQGGKKSTPGLECNRLYQFLGALGFDWAKGSPPPPEAGDCANWIDRIVDSTIKAGGTFKGQDGTLREGYNKAAWFSYRRPGEGAEPGTEAASTAGRTNGAGGAGGATNGAAAGAGNDLDDV